MHLFYLLALFGARTVTALNKSGNGTCVLPPHPENGTYAVNGEPNATAGQVYPFLVINVTCNKGFGVVGPNTIFCYNGYWSETFPKCVLTCDLQPHPSVDFSCRISSGGTRPCEQREPSGTVVYPRCQNFYNPVNLTSMTCVDGVWDHVARCTPDCGTIIVEEQLIIIGYGGRRGTLPWNAGIYSKKFAPYKQVCGGTLISKDVVVSAAHCFWSDLEKQLPPSTFAVAVGKENRAWKSPDTDQKSDVKEIRLPARFRGATTNFQDDLAIVKVSEPFEFNRYVRPACLSFDDIEDAVVEGTKGTVGGWGLTAANGKESPVLQVMELPYVDVSKCIANLPSDFSAYITSDKICAGTIEGIAGVCRGDSGGGLLFPVVERGVKRYYLRGIASTAPRNIDACNTATYATFTHVAKHERFIKQFLTDL